MSQYRVKIWGRATVGPEKKWDCGTKRHKPAQIGTNFCAGTKLWQGSFLAPFFCRLKIIVD
jgi:hypothetical protein